MVFDPIENRADFMDSPKNSSERKIGKKILGIVKETIATHHMFNPGDSVLVAVSGGPDSVVLAHVLRSLAVEYPLRLAIAHLNHGLREEESDRDADFVAAFARHLDLPFYTAKKEVRVRRRGRQRSLEEAARKIRYQFFNDMAQRHGFNKIALGHHSDDNAELVLMFLLRGSGPLGLSGIPPVRDGKYVRPLINLKRSEILAYTTEKKLNFVSDSTNADPRFLRNKIRHHLIPELQHTYNPQIIETINRLASILREEDRWLDALLEPVFNRCVRTDDAGGIRLEISDLEPLGGAAKRRIVRKAIAAVKKDLRRITFSHIDAVLRLLETGTPGGSLSLPRGITAVLTREALLILKGKIHRFRSDGRPARPISRDYAYSIAGPGSLHIAEANATITLTEVGPDGWPDLQKNAGATAFFDMERLQFPLEVRNVRGGDRFSPLGVGGTQKVKKFFINRKVPRQDREKCPILLSRGKIVWVAGHRIDNSVKVGPQTRRILKAELNLA